MKTNGWLRLVACGTLICFILCVIFTEFFDVGYETDVSVWGVLGTLLMIVIAAFEIQPWSNAQIMTHKAQKHQMFDDFMTELYRAIHACRSGNTRIRLRMESSNKGSETEPVDILNRMQNAAQYLDSLNLKTAILVNICPLSLINELQEALRDYTGAIKHYVAHPNCNCDRCKTAEEFEMIGVSGVSGTTGCVETANEKTPILTRLEQAYTQIHHMVKCSKFE